jgi:hypothetical protein
MTVLWKTHNATDSRAQVPHAATLSRPRAIPTFEGYSSKDNDQ